MLTAVIALALGLSAGIAGPPGEGGDPAASAAPRLEQQGERTKLRLRGSPYGRVVFADGFAMYAFTDDQRRRSNCRGACARAWPPLIAEGAVVAGRGIEGRVGTIRRRDGTRQVTLAGRPLYGYVDDPRGEILCQNVFEFGGTWLVVRGSGEPVR